MAQIVTFNESKIGEISDRYLPKPGKTLSKVRREEIILSMTSDITSLMIPVDEPEAIVAMDPINNALRQALPEAGRILSKDARVASQREIAQGISVVFKIHNDKVEADERAERMRLADQQAMLELEKENELRSTKLKWVVGLLAAGAIGIALIVYALNR